MEVKLLKRIALCSSRHITTAGHCCWVFTPECCR